MPYAPPPKMSSFQFEALCRHAISRLTRLPPSDIHTGHLPGSTLSNAKTRHQIDLYWTSSDGVSNFLTIANAKWRNEASVQLPDLLTLLAVQHDTHAQKAMLITNTHFSAGVIAQAKDKGVALLIVRPTFDPSTLPRSHPSLILKSLEERAVTHPINPLFTAEIIHKHLAPQPFHHLPDPSIGQPEVGSHISPPPPQSTPFEGEDFTCLIESASPSEDAIDHKMLDDTCLTNRMIDNPPSHKPPPPPPFGLRTK